MKNNHSEQRILLLTGATGFVGKQILLQLIESCVRVRLVVRTGSLKKIPDCVQVDSVISTPDLFAESSEWWSEVCTGVDTVLHVAWYAEPGKYLHAPQNLDCLVGTIRLSQGASKAGVSRFVGVGTCLEYDVSERPLSTDAPLRPRTPYAGSKAAAYMALSQSLPTVGMEFAWCRLFYLYGEGEDPRRLIPYLHSRLAAGKTAKLSSGTQLRDFLDVKDAARRIVTIAQSHRQGAINVCSGKPISIRQLAESIADIYDGHELLRFGIRPDDKPESKTIVGIPDYAG